ncbi:membrane-bound serine protease (ClpP class) [Candidatus Magnetoovum chiemensis]|nr:membrane-bound serine protease (ClpP class) [Candidatus Magnetoovum chiemensis]
MMRLRRKLNSVCQTIGMLVLALTLFILIAALRAQDINAQNEESSGSSKILTIEVNGVINPVSSEHIRKTITEANTADYSAVLIQLDTPGGLDTSMRDIIKSINSSAIPIIVYVSPSGARAASAGVFITMAAHIAAMAPSTNIGAAHPVAVSGKMDKTMSQKAENDAVAYIKSIAKDRGRNEEWAENAVRKSVSVPETEALTIGIIDIVSSSVTELLEKINGKTINIKDKTIKLNTATAQIIKKDLSLRLKILDIISDPNIAYILMMLGFWGFYFEFSNPGAIFPGVMGAISLILAFYAFQTLPVNYAGFLLIIVGIILLVLEIKIISHGILTIGGIISMTIGSLMLFDSDFPFYQLSINLVVITVGMTALFFAVVIRLAYNAWKRKPLTGKEGIIDSIGISKTTIEPNKEGMIIVHGELWRAYSDNFIENGKEVIVIEMVGLRVKVREKTQK